jgi:hypothetical protein
MNYYNHDGTSIHAERNLFDKLPSQKKNKKINILVVRFTKMGALCMSRPCDKCIYFLSVFPQRKGYRIGKIYYSDQFGNIIKSNLYKLQQLQI